MFFFNKPSTQYYTTEDSKILYQFELHVTYLVIIMYYKCGLKILYNIFNMDK